MSATATKTNGKGKTNQAQTSTPASNANATSTPKKERKPRGPIHSFEEFCIAHDEATSWEELAEKLGITVLTAQMRANKYKDKKGVQLKDLPRRNGTRVSNERIQKMNELLAQRRAEREKATQSTAA